MHLTDERVPPVVLAEAAPAASEGANTGAAPGSSG
jgi:hypothetical protein